jgi:hypothetical protein
MQQTFPEERTLSKPERLRLFADDVNEVKTAAGAAGLEPDEVKRRAVHVGLPILIKALGIGSKIAAKKPRA